MERRAVTRPVEHAHKRARQGVLVDRRKLDVAQMWRSALTSGFGRIACGLLEECEQMIGEFDARCHASGRNVPNAGGRTFRQLQNTTGKLICPDCRTMLIADNRYRKITIAAVPQPIPMSGPSIQ